MITNVTKDVLQLYDENDLLRTIPNNYKLNSLILKSYSKHCKPTQLVELNLTESHINFLTALAQNANAPFSLVFNFLIETVADCGKIHTKRIKQALDCYYYAVAHDKELFSKILSEYALSNFYKEDVGLSEEGVAYFLATSTKRTRNIK